MKLHVYLDDWLIRADTPEQAKLHAQTTIRVLQFLGWIIKYEKSDFVPSQDFSSSSGGSSTLDFFTVASLPKMRRKVQSIHQHWITDPNRDLHRFLSVLVFMALLVRRRRLCSSPGSSVGHHSMVPEDRELVRPDPSSSVGSVRGAWWASPAVLQGLPLVTKEREVTLFTDASSSGWGAQLGSRLTWGQWSASQRSWHFNALEMQAVINTVRDFLPHLRSRVVRLMCYNVVTGLHQERGGAEIAHFDAADHTTAEVVRPQGDYVGSRPSARSAQHPGGFPVQSRPDTDHGVVDGHGAFTTRVCQVGRAAGRLVCNIRQ